MKTQLLKSSIKLFLLVLLTMSHAEARKWEEMSKEAAILHRAGKYNEALPLAIKAAAKAKRQMGVNSREYALELSRVAKVQLAIGQFEDARKTMVEVLKVDSALGYSEIQQCVARQTLPFSWQGIPESAYREYRFPCASAASVLPCTEEEDSSFLDHINTLSETYLGLGDIRSATTAINMALRMERTLDNINTAKYSSIIRNLANSYIALGEYTKAQALCKEALKTDSLYLGVNDPNFAEDLKQHAEIDALLGNYERALSYGEKATQILEKKYGRMHPEYAFCLNRLASFEFVIGDYKKAADYNLQSLKIIKTQIGENSPHYADALHDLAKVYHQTKRYSDAIDLLEEAIQIDSSVLGTRHPAYSRLLSSLATVRSDLIHHQMADSLHLGRIIFDSVSHQRINLILVQSNLRRISKQLIEEYANAESLFLASMLIDSIQLGINHPNYGSTLSNLAILYERNGNYSKAKVLLEESEKIIGASLGKQNPTYTNILYELARVLKKCGETSEMYAVLEEASRLRIQFQLKNICGLTFDQRTRFWKQEEKYFTILRTFSLPSQDSIPQLMENGFENSVYAKELLLRSWQINRHAISSIKNIELIRLYAKYQENQLLQSMHPQKAKESQSKDGMFSVLNKIQIVENQMLENSAAQINPDNLYFEFNKVRDAIPKGAVVIEFTRFFYSGNDEIENDAWYGAYILRTDSTLPIFLRLFSEKELATIVNPGENDFVNSPRESRIYAFRGIAPIENDHSLSRISVLIWHQLEPYLSQITDIYYSPTGLLHNISFAALCDVKGMRLSEKYRLHLMGTIGRLVIGNQPLYADDIQSAVIFGGMDYDLDDSLRENDPYMAFRGQKDHASGIVNRESTIHKTPWKNLPGTNTEAKEIQSMMKRSRILSTLVMGEEAVEASFKGIDRNNYQASPSMIHVATHGFSNPASGMPFKDREVGDFSSRFYLSTDPMQRSGLTFSGANRVWLGGEPLLGVDDGILTAAEIANMDLDDTKLVVLSACQSGLGEIQGDEGVFGLQRAFKLAGVELILATLWEVPDVETAEFMELFYGFFLRDGLEVREAFFQAQKEMRERYQDEPYLWAAFVLME